MQYPTMGEVELANHLQLARWFRFLPPPGSRAIDGGRDAFERAMAGEKIILDHIVRRFRGMGGMNPELSKRVGWGGFGTALREDDK